jgi:hypothetical protein
MSIRMIATDLYRAIRKVEEVERALESAPIDRRDQLLDHLRRAKAERDQLRRLLDGRKD